MATSPKESARSPQELVKTGEVDRFQRLVQSVQHYAIFLLDANGCVETWNPGAEATKGYRAEEIIGRHISTFYTPEDLAAGKPEHLLRLARHNGRVEDEGWRVRKDGTLFWADVVISSTFDEQGRLLGYSKVTRDLTERRALDEERLQLTRANEALRMRDEFLSIASHELRTPLTAMQLQLESLLQALPPTEEKLRRRAEKALAGGERLTRLVEALLDVSRLATGNFTLAREEVDLVQLVKDVVEHLQESLRAAGCELILRPLAPVTGVWDRLRIEQVITNLVSNAMKYAAGTTIQVEVRADGPDAILSVEDAGPGIPPSEWPRIFDRFERAASLRHYGGLGLGLYVTRQICLAHGGNVRVEGVQPTGARFVAQLPRGAEGKA